MTPLKTAEAAPSKVSSEIQMVALITLGSLLVKIIYLLFSSQYGEHLVTDMGAYWFRANQRFLGNPFSPLQWSVWPILPHLIMSEVFRVAYWFDVFPMRLEFLLIFFCALSSASTLFVYGLGKEMLPNKELLLLAVFSYAFSFPQIYLGTFVLSENLTGPFLIAACYFLVKNKGDIWRFLGSGFFLGLAVGTRPNFLLFLFPFVIFLGSPKRSGIRPLRSVGFFLIGFLMVVLSLVAENSRISGGQMKAFSANGGINFFVEQCKPYTLKSISRIGTYVIGYPSFVGESERGVFMTDHAPYDQAYFVKEGLKCMANNPLWWLDNLKMLPRIFSGVIMPTFLEMPGFFLIPIWHKAVLGCVLAFLLFALIRFKERKQHAVWYLLVSLPFITMAQVIFFPLEMRYLYPLFFVFYLGIFSVAGDIKKHKITVLLAIVFLVAGTAGWRTWKVQQVQTLEKIYGAPIAKTVWLQSLREPKAAGLAWNAFGNLIIPDGKAVRVKAGGSIHASGLEISADCNDSYEIHFYLNRREVGTILVPAMPEFTGGLAVRPMLFPGDLAKVSFDEVVIKPHEGDQHYSVGHLRFTV